MISDNLYDFAIEVAKSSPSKKKVGAVLLNKSKVVESATMNTGTDATAALGFTGGDVDEFAAALDIDGAADGAYAPQVAIDGLALSTSGDTIDFVLAVSGASFSAGKLRAWAVMMDISDQGDMAAAEVARDNA